MAQSLVQVDLTVQTQTHDTSIIQARSIFMSLAITALICCCQINATACQCKSQNNFGTFSLSVHCNFPTLYILTPEMALILLFLETQALIFFFTF